MLTLTQKNKLLNLSLTFDTLTIYSNFTEEDEENTDKFDVVHGEISDIPDFDFLVLPSDADHLIYHNNELGKNEKSTPHIHFKFCNLLTEKNLELVLDILIKNDLLSTEDKEKVFNTL